VALNNVETVSAKEVDGQTYYIYEHLSQVPTRAEMFRLCQTSSEPTQCTQLTTVLLSDAGLPHR
jgi:hypothetical protein